MCLVSLVLCFHYWLSLSISMHVVLTLSLLTLNMYFLTGLSPEGRYPTDKYLLEVNNKNTSLVSSCWFSSSVHVDFEYLLVLRSLLFPYLLHGSSLPFTSLQRFKARCNFKTHGLSSFFTPFFDDLKNLNHITEGAIKETFFPRNLWQNFDEVQS